MPVAEKEIRARPTVPRINPTIAPFVVCSNKDCTELLKPQVVKGKGGSVPDIVYVCPKCEYQFILSYVPALGSCRALTEEERDKLRAGKGGNRGTV